MTVRCSSCTAQHQKRLLHFWCFKEKKQYSSVSIVTEGTTDWMPENWGLIPGRQRHVSPLHSILTSFCPFGSMGSSCGNKWASWPLTLGWRCTVPPLYQTYRWRGGMLIEHSDNFTLNTSFPSAMFIQHNCFNIICMRVFKNLFSLSGCVEMASFSLSVKFPFWLI
jgi:hypothetical protein